MKKTLFAVTVLFSLMVSGAANAVEKSSIYLFLPGILHSHTPPIGFRFTKLGTNGNPLTNQAADYINTPWACVKDNVTGLIWEVKTNDGGLHEQNDKYFWYNTNPADNGGEIGYPDSGNSCVGYVAGRPSTYCNTQEYTARVNAAGWCGASDWRMPTAKELVGIVSSDRVNPAIDIGYFPNTPSSPFWSRSPYVISYADGAWFVDFRNGDLGSNFSFESYQVRLVRGGQ